MIFEDFHRTLRLLATVDMQELVDAEAIHEGDLPTWNAFRADPLRWLLRADDDTAHAVWAAMQRHKRRGEMIFGSEEPDVKQRVHETATG
jgi:hypothetical protein